jgi:Flp pilus assembly protein TadD
MAISKKRHLLHAFAAALLVLQLSGCAKNDAPSLIASGKAYMAKADYTAAAIQLKSALQIAPENAEARFLLAKSLLESGDAAAAETEARKALELKYSADEAMPLLARSMLAQGKYDRVISEMGKVDSASAQTRASVGTSVAMAYLAIGDAKNAGTAIDKALAGLPADARGLTVKAQIAAASNDLSEASELIGAALALAPKDIEALMVRAQLEATAGHRDQAVAKRIPKPSGRESCSFRCS